MDSIENSTERNPAEYKIYHEKQRQQLCAIHSMNNLFQDMKACTKQQMDDVCYTLNASRWNNPHKSMMGFGNYDVNAITSFLHTKNYDVIWFDKRKSIESIRLEDVFGFLLNGTSKYKLFNASFTLSSHFKHWYVVRMLHNGLYFNLDSKLKKPVNIGNRTRLVEFLKERLLENDCELLLVVQEGLTREHILQT